MAHSSVRAGPDFDLWALWTVSKFQIVLGDFEKWVIVAAILGKPSSNRVVDRRAQVALRVVQDTSVLRIGNLIGNGSLCQGSRGHLGKVSVLVNIV